MSELSNDPLAARLEDLETQNAYLQHQLNQLDEVVRRQGDLVDALRSEIIRQKNMLEGLEEVVRESPANGLNR
jgi:preprotein translocase subunit SecA